MQPADFRCRRCWKGPGEGCVNPDGSPVLVSGEPWFHAERYQDAESQEVQGANVSKEEFGEVLDQTGLV